MKKPNKINLFNANKEFREGFFDYCKKAGVDVEHIRLRYSILHLKNGEKTRFIYKNEEFDVDNAYNFVRLRGIESHLPSLLSLYCEKKGIRFNDLVNLQHTRSVNKMTQMLMLSLNGLPIPETIFISKYSYWKNRDYVKGHMQFPCVLKAYGDRGLGVWKIERIEDLDERMKITKDVEQLKKDYWKIETFIVQEYIQNDHDIRVTMFEHEVLGVIKRISVDGFYNNFSRGAGYEVSEVSKEEEELCKKACDACDIDLGGVDFVRTDDGILFFEINKSPQINKKYPAMIAERIAEKYLEK